MLTHLQDWIHRAEASGIHALQEAALRMRSYRHAPARKHRVCKQKARQPPGFFIPLPTSA